MCLSWSSSHKQVRMKWNFRGARSWKCNITHLADNLPSCWVAHMPLLSSWRLWNISCLVQWLQKKKTKRNSHKLYDISILYYQKRFEPNIEWPWCINYNLVLRRTFTDDWLFNKPCEGHLHSKVSIDPVPFMCGQCTGMHQMLFFSLLSLDPLFNYPIQPL